MGAAVKEVLRRLCSEFGWTYSVFWRAVASADPHRMRLVWEDGHYERSSSSVAPAASGFEAIDQLIKESGVLRSSQNGRSLAQFGSQTEDRIQTLVFKLMATQVHIVGDGIVGKAALTGKHEWVAADLATNDGSVPKDSSELNNQFLAGVKTVAIIPVLPHGVVQLGSSQMVLENFGFVYYVKHLFEQLHHVPCALVSYTNQVNSCQNIQSHEAVRTQAASKHVGEVGSMNNLSAIIGDTGNYWRFAQSDSRAIMEHCASVAHVDDQMPTSVTETPSIKEESPCTMLPFSFQKTSHVNPSLLGNSLLKSGLPGAYDFCSNPEAEITKNAFPCESKSQNQSYIPIGLPCSRLRIIEQQLLSVSGMRSGELANSNESALINTNLCKLQSYGCTSSNSVQGSDIISSFAQSQSFDVVNDIGRFHAFPSGSHNSQSQFAVSSCTEVAPLFNLPDRVVPMNLEPDHLNSIHDKSESRSSADMKKINSGESQVLKSQYSNADDYGSSKCSLLGTYPKIEEHIMQQDYAGVGNSCTAAPSRNGGEGKIKADFLQPLDEKVSLTSLVSAGNDLFDMLQHDQHKFGFCHSSLDGMNMHVTANAHELSTDISTCITELEEGPAYSALNDDNSCSGIFSEAGSDQLLDAIVSQFKPGVSQSKLGSRFEIDDNASCKTSLTKTSSSSLHTSSANNGWVASPKQANGATFGLPRVPIKSKPAASSSVKSSCSTERDEKCFPQSNGGYKSQINLWTQDQRHICDNHSVANGKRVEETGKQIRKRAKPGENARPRPKDRQMIQDRVKELREIIPNGAKCSIDALLEKTIKHMLFLQSVTKHADKLKETGEPKILSKEGGLLLKDNFEGGATWAFEVGSQSMICPIIVEDLNPPRQMLVEMLCEERGQFLEIADMVRGLGLTILKGVMEARNDKVWARFAVEANRDVTRMEIFMSLVQLLEPSIGSNAAPAGVDNLSKLQNMFRSPSVPAAGLSNPIW